MTGTITAAELAEWIADYADLPTPWIEVTRIRRLIAALEAAQRELSSTTIVVPPTLSIPCAWCDLPIVLHGYVEASVWCERCGGETLVRFKRGRKRA